MTPLLSARGIGKRFGAVVALANGGLVVAPGEIHALLGANGSGKSTLCKIIAGTVVPDAGEIAFSGAPIAPKSPRDAEALGIALFYQELSLVPQLSVADNVFLGHERRRGPLLDIARQHEDAQALIARFAGVAGEGFLPEAPVARLSPDQRQIVEILKVLARKPRLIIFDEATAALDGRQVEVFFSLLRALKAEGVSSILITHRMDEVFAISDRITVMRNGESVASYATPETSRNEVVHAMVGDTSALAERTARPARAPGKAPLLTVENVTSRRLAGVSFTLAPGEILGLGGLQGQGQSALLQGLFGAQPFASGTVRRGDRPVALRRPAQAMREGFAYVSGDRGRDAALHGRSIFENVAAASLAREGGLLVRPRALKPRLLSALQSLDTRYAGLEAPIGSLSGGNQQKVFIARWLATRSAVLLFDDPTKGIDLAAKADFFALVRGLAEEGAGIVFYASEDAELLGLCDRILVFNSGSVAAELSGDTLTAFHLTNAAYGRAA